MKNISGAERFGRWRWVPAVCILVAFPLIGGCVSSERSPDREVTSSDDSGINEPLPRMSKKKAEEWARHFTESMARSAHVEIAPETIDPAFNNCVGEGDEVASDGRFTLDYYARAPIEVAEQSVAVKRVRDDLKSRGYEVLGLQEVEGKESSIILDARSKEKGFSVSVEGSYKDPDLLFSVMTPCLLPPGVDQEEF